MQKVPEVIGANITQTLFEQDMSTVSHSDLTAAAFAGMKNASDIVQLESGMKNLMPAFLKQANLSTWYQNNPWPILTSSLKYGVESPLGGPLELDQPPGYRPGNVLYSSSEEPSSNDSTLEAFGNSYEEGSSSGNYVMLVGFIVLIILLGVFFANNS